MKIEKIIINNLTSIAGEQVIDFTKEPLRSAGLFAITGDTGAGKSTILDAICLALYDHAPRFDGVEVIKQATIDQASDNIKSIKPSDCRGILRRGCKEGGCVVEFSMPDGSRYEATWSLRVKRTGTYERAQRSLRCLAPRKETIPEAEIKTRLPEIIGLDYEQFTRTVLLAQNSFANFLRAKSKDKSTLLEKITGTEIYGRISQKIHASCTEAERRVADIENVVSGILHDRLLPEELASLQEERTLLSARIEAINGRKKLVDKQLSWFAEFDAATRQLANMEAAHAEANKACMAMRAEEMSLQRYDDVLAIQPLYQEIVMRRNDIAESKQAEASVASEIETERLRLNKATAALDEAHERTAEAENRLSLRRPAIGRGHVLNGEISEAKGQFRKAEEQLHEAHTLLEERDTALAVKKQQLADNIAELERLQLHAQALAVHRLMFEKFDLIKDKLAALNVETRRNEDSHKKLAQLQKQQAELKASSVNLEKKRHDDEDRITALKGELLIHRQSNSGHDSARLQQRFADSRNRLLGLQRADALWNRISAGYEEIEEKRAALNRLEASQAQLRRDVAQAERDFAIREETYKRLNVALTLSQSENIVRLRKQLKEGTACPVCGATHHPYHTETERELGELLNNLEKEFEEATEELNVCQTKLDELRRNFAAGDGRLEASRTNLEEREKLQAADVEEWDACKNLDPSFADCSPSVARQARHLMIGLLIDNTKRAAGEAEKELETFNFHQGHINRLNEQIARLESIMAESRAHLDSLRTDFKIASAAAEDAEHDMTVSDRTCGELYADLDSMITLSGWFTEWKNNPDGFRLRLTERYDDWQRTTKDVDSYGRSQALLREGLKSAESSRAQAALRETQALQARDAIMETLESKRTELRRLFADNSPEKEEQQLAAVIDQARATEAKVRAEKEDAAGRLQQLQGRQKILIDNRQKRQTELSTNMSDLDLWLLRFNANHSPMQFAELETIFSDKRDWRAIRDKLEQLKENLTLASNRLQSAREALLVLRSVPDHPSGDGEESRETLMQVAESLTAEATDVTERLTQTKLRLLSHERSVKQAETYTNQVAKAREDAEEWRRLDTLLGSYDGTKFRDLAQSYTFSYLVAHANMQLKQFSPRYELHNLAGTLTLEIIDRDMFDEHRFVTSLSGGETFVVSLALALALASLSGNNLAIGSLFIDEGFGNLDHDSLDLVMSALANLENQQGRKVGVISHTDQIRSQISPQIRLVKQPCGGRSRIEIG